MSRSYRTRTLALVALAAALALALAFSLRGGSDSGTAFAAATAAPADALANAQKTLTFTGAGDVELQPDTAHVNISVHGAGDTSDQAQAVATTKMNAVLAALKALDSVKIAEDDLETQGINTGRDWEHEGRYVSDQSLGVTILEHGTPVLVALVPGILIGIAVAALLESSLGLGAFVGPEVPFRIRVD